ncbi:uncharacterized protein LOC143446619 [Clavelina lepadiformis]|uniref:uncharacterized protein LOC143446619 n=1 Tax=Clavelina lepadiformis TaxID=159417 RepID=UPI00404340DB
MASTSKAAISTTAAKLEELSKQHEAEIVIELGMDRLLKWVGVYLLLAMAIVVKVVDFIGNPNLTCYPANHTPSIKREFIAFANTYCWEAWNVVANPMDICPNLTTQADLPLLESPEKLKFLVQWLPYFIILQVFLFALPNAFWHFRVGAPLMGHLKFIQLLLEDIFQELQDINLLPLKDEAYDENSSHLDFRRKYKVSGEQQDSPDVGHEVCCGAKKSRRKDKPIDDVTRVEVEEEQLVDGSTEDKTVCCICCFPDCKKCECCRKSKHCRKKRAGETKLNNGYFCLCSRKPTTWARFISGDMMDKNLFSMFCFENFSSLQQLPYILSVFQLSGVKVEDEIGELEPPLKSLLHHWCHKNNFKNRFLVTMYLLKHIATSLFSLVMLGLLIGWLIAISHDISTSETFRCQLPHYELCVLCTIKRKREILAIICLDIAITVIVFVLSVTHWLMTRCSSEKAVSKFFEDLKKTSNVALKAAKESRKVNKEKEQLHLVEQVTSVIAGIKNDNSKFSITLSCADSI